MLYENNFLENPFREYILDKYQQVLYENAGIFSFILCKIPDKYQQVLYENLGVHASNPMHQLININRCCTKTPLIITTLISLLLDKYQQVLYENVSSPPPITKPITDKYQHVLYENHFLNICKCFFY